MERIVDRVEKGRKNGYIWHTTGSGKTLTSFKAAQVVIENPKVDKVVFVVDRADLDYQATKEFNHFSPGSVDGTDNTKALVAQLAGPTKLIVTTIQKLNTAITREKHEAALEPLRKGRVVFIFDECHRSQFGDTHRHIVKFFERAQLFGFTGTPILKENAIGMRTTADLFDEPLHKYVITDAIRDENVLRFAVEYWGKLKRKADGELMTDEEVAGLDLTGFWEDQTRIDNVVDWIIENHGRKTHNRTFGAIMAVGSVEVLTRYYEAFKRTKLEGKHDLRVATIFTFAPNEDDAEATGLIGEEDVTGGAVTVTTQHSRDKLAACVADYNAMFGTGNSVKDGKAFYTYYKGLAKRMKARDRKDFVPDQGIDILLVVNMFLTGFDAKTVNTLYVDKNLRYHGLIQALSRTNRILGQLKSQGNIVAFRNLKERVDQAIALFSNKDAKEKILIEPYENYVDQFNAAVQVLQDIAKKPADVDGLESEDDLLLFVQAFRELMRIRNVLQTFAEFDPDDLSMTPQRFEDFKSKYLDIYDRARSNEDGDANASIIDEVDFELELIRRDNINVAYILALLASIAATADGDEDAAQEAETKKKAILDALGSEPRLRSKRELIEEFIASHMPGLSTEEDTWAAFREFWEKKRSEKFDAICVEEGLVPEEFGRLMSGYRFTGSEPLTDDIISIFTESPGILQRKKKANQIVERMATYIETFDDHLGDIDAI